jgi:hypothetical protein
MPRGFVGRSNRVVKGKLVKKKLTPELVQASALQLRRMKIGETRAMALARDVGRLNDVALAAAEETDFNDEPASFASLLVRLKAPDARR